MSGTKPISAAGVGSPFSRASLAAEDLFLLTRPQRRRSDGRARAGRATSVIRPEGARRVGCCRREAQGTAPAGGLRLRRAAGKGGAVWCICYLMSRRAGPVPDRRRACSSERPRGLCSVALPTSGRVEKCANTRHVFPSC